MRDMTAADAQDLLPDLLHGRLSEAARADVERIIGSDPDLAAQLALLQQVHAAHAAAPAVDVSRIVAALPAASGQRAGGTVFTTTGNVDELAARRAPLRAPRMSRLAFAAALLLVLGGGAVVATRAARDTALPVATITHAESLALVENVVHLGLGTPTDELTVEQLRALEQDIQALDGVPSAEPDDMTDLVAGEGA